MSDRLNDIKSRLAARNSNTSGSGQTSSGLSYAANLSKEAARNIFGRQDFVQDAMDYYRERDGASFSNVDEVRDYFMNDRRWRNMNSFSIGKDVYDANTSNDVQSTRLARLQSVFDAMPDFYEEGGDGWSGFFTNALATVADPINLIGFGAGGQAAKLAASQVMKKASSTALSKVANESLRREALKEGLKSGIYRGARNEAIVSGAVEGGLDAGIQARNTELGLQDGYSVAQGAMAVGGGAVLGGALGGVFGAAGAVAPNPFKGNKSAISQGIIEGRQEVRQEAAATREADRIDVPEVDATPVEAVDPLMEQAQARLASLEAAKVDADEPNFEVEAAAVADTEADRLRSGINRLQDLKASELSLGQKAEAEAASGKVDASAKTRAAQAEAKKLSVALEASLRKVVDNQQVTDEAVMQGVADATEVPQLLLEFDPSAKTKAEGDGFKMEDGESDPSTGIFRTLNTPVLKKFEGDDTPLSPDDAPLGPEDEAARLKQEAERIAYAERKAALLRGEDAPEKLREELDLEVKMLDRSVDYMTEEIEKRRAVADIDEEAKALLINLDGTDDALASPNAVRVAKANGVALEDGVEARTQNILEGLRRVQEENTARNSQNAKESGDLQKGLDKEKRNLEIAKNARETSLNSAEEKDLNVYSALNESQLSLKEKADTRIALEEQQVKDAQDLAASGTTEYELFSQSAPAQAYKQRVEYLTDVLGFSPKFVKSKMPKDRRSKGSDEKIKEVFVELFQIEYTRQEVEARIAGFEDVTTDEGTIFYSPDRWNLELNEAYFDTLFGDEALSKMAYDEYLQGIEADGLIDIAYQQAKVSIDGTRLVVTDPEAVNILVETYGSGFASMAVKRFYNPKKIKAARMGTASKSDIEAFVDSLDDEFKISMNSMKRQYLTQLIAKGDVTEPQARRMAQDAFDARVDRAMRGEDDIVSRSNTAIKQQIARTEENLARMTEARSDWLEAMKKLPASNPDKQRMTVQFNKNIIIDTNKLDEAIANNELDVALVGRGRKITVQGVGVLSLEQAQDVVAIQEFAEAASVIADIKNSYVTKGLQVGEIISRENDNIRKLNNKLDTTQRISIRQRNGRNSSSIETSDIPNKNAPHIGRTIIKNLDGTYGVGGRSSALFQKAQRIVERDMELQDGVRTKKSAIQTAQDRTDQAAIDSKSENTLQFNPESAKRYAEELKPIEAAIDDIKRAKSAVYAAEKALKDVDNQKRKKKKTPAQLIIDVEIAQSTLSEAEAAGKKLTGSFLINSSQSQTVLGGLGQMRASYVMTGQKQVAGDRIAAEKNERPLNTLRKAWRELHAELKDADNVATEARRKILLETRNAIKIIGETIKKDPEFIVDDALANSISEAVFNQALREVGAAKRAALHFKKEVASGMYAEDAYQTAGMDRFDEIPSDGDLVPNNDITDPRGPSSDEIDQVAEAVLAAERAGDPAPSYQKTAAEIGVKVSVDDNVKIENSASQINKRVVAKRQREGAHKAINWAFRTEPDKGAKAEAFAQAEAEYQEAIATGPVTVASKDRVEGKRMTPVMVTLKSGLEVDAANDFSYNKIEGSSQVDVSFGGETIGRIETLPDGKKILSRKAPKDSKNPYIVLGPYMSSSDLLKRIPHAFSDYVDAAQEIDHRFTVNEDAKGAPHFNDDPAKTLTHANSKKVALVQGEKADPLDEPPIKADPNNMLTWTEADFEISEGYRLAIQFLDPENEKLLGVVRPASKTRRVTVLTILGKGKDLEYVIGAVKKGKGQLGAQETFRPLDPAEMFIDQRGVKMTGLEKAEIDAAMTGVFAPGVPQSGRRRTVAPSNLDVIKNKDLISSSRADMQILKSQNISTVGDLVEGLEIIEMTSFSKMQDQEQQLAFFEMRSAMARVFEENVKNGLQKPNSNLARATNEIRAIFDGHDAREAQTCIDFLERLSIGTNGILPKIEGSNQSAYSQNAPSVDVGKRNKIFLDTKSEKTLDGLRDRPITMDLIHETAHWLYANVLTEGEKSIFWGSMSKLYTDGKLDMSEFKMRTLDPDLVSNSQDDPGELFANQFLAYALRESNDIVRAPGSPLMAMFERVSRYGSTLLKWMRGDNTAVYMTLDEDLQKVFERFLPKAAIDPLTEAPYKTISKFAHLKEAGRKFGTPSSKAIISASGQASEMTPAEFAGLQLAVLDDRITKLQAAKMFAPRGTGDSYGLAVELEQVAREVYGEYGGTKDMPNHNKSSRVKDGGGTARIMALDRTGARAPIMEAQFRIHAFLQQLRLGDTQLPSVRVMPNVLTRTNGINDGQSASDVISRDLAAGYKIDAQDQMSRIMADSKAGYQSLDAGVVDYLHTLSTDLQIALQGGVKEYTMMFQRNMPSNKKGEFIGINPYTGDATIDANSKISSYHKKVNAKLLDEAVADELALKKVVAELNSSSSVLRTDDQIRIMHSRTKAELLSDQALEKEIVNAEKISDMSKVSEDLAELQRRNKSKITEAKKNEAREVLENKNNEDDEKLQGVEDILASGDEENIEALRNFAEKNGDTAILTLLSERLPADAPPPLNTKPTSTAVKALGDALTNRNSNAQEIGKALFSRLAEKLGLSDEGSYITEYDLAILTGRGLEKDMRNSRMMEGDAEGVDTTALADMSDDELSPVPTDHPDFNALRNTLRKVSEAIHELNIVRQKASDKTEEAQKIRLQSRRTEGEIVQQQAALDEAVGYDARSDELRAEIFPKIFDIMYRMQPDSQRVLITKAALTNRKKVSDLIVNAQSKMYKSGVIGDQVKGDTARAINQIFVDTAQLLDGQLMQPQSLKEQRMESKRISYSDLGRAKREENLIQSSVKDGNGDTRVHPSVAGKFARSFLDTMPEDLRRSVAAFGGAEGPNDPNFDNLLRFNVSEEGNVAGRTSSEGPYGRGVYTTSTRNVDRGYNADTLVDGINKQLDQSNITPVRRRAADVSTKNIVVLREKIRELSGSDKLNYRDSELLDHLLRIERKHWGVLSDLSDGEVIDQKVVPVFVRMRKPFDISKRSEYTMQEGRIQLDNLILEMAFDTKLPKKVVEKIVRATEGGVTGLGLYRALTDGTYGALLEHPAVNSSRSAKEMFRKFLISKGYDGFNTDEGSVSFAEANVRTATGEANDTFSDVEVGSTTPDKPYSSKLTASIVEEMMVINDKLPNSVFLGTALEAQRLGMPKPMLKVVEKVQKGRTLSEEDVNNVGAWSSVKNFFRENSSMFRQEGANWFADLIKPEKGHGTFERHDAMLARRLQPIMSMLNELPDGGNNFTRWSKRNRGLALGALDEGQPASHKRILKALRKGRGAVQRLDPKERAVALKIGAGFNDELVKMQALGIKVGDARKLGSDFYVPQVWDTEGILANPDRFKRGLVSYFQREQQSPEHEVAKKTTEELKQLAERVLAKLMRGHNSSFDNDIKNSISNPFQSRLIRLQPGDIDEMDDFLVQDLQGTLAKYYDRTIRKRVLTEQFGINGHAFDTYVDIAADGKEAAVSNLMSEFRANDPMATENGMNKSDDLTVARLGLSGDEVRSLVDKVLATLGGTRKSKISGKQEAISILTAAAGPEGSSIQYAKRVEAVVNGLIDFGPNIDGVRSSTRTKMQQMMHVLNKKPIDGGDGTEAKYKISRLLKSFTSVSLLSFTTLTSIPDLALPLVRSGNMRAFARTWAKYMSDADYRASAKNIGTGIENLMHERMVHMSGEGNQKFTNAFFNATLLTPWTNTMREVASLVGFEAMKAEINRASRMKRNGKQGTKSYATAVRFLERYGLTGEGASHDFLSDGSFRIDGLPKDEAIQMQVQMAMLRFTNEAIFTPNPNDVPLWGQGPWGSMMFQLKSFPIMMQRMGKYLLDEAGDGNYYPLLYMATFGVGAGAASMSLKDKIQMRGGEDEKSFANRDRSMSASKEGLAEILGISEGSMTDDYLGWYVDGLMAVGGLGFLGELLYNSSAQLENGKYGFVRVLSSVAGPQIGTAELVFDTGSAIREQAMNAMTGSDDNSKTRVATGNLLRRVPVAGGISSVRLNAQDAIAGGKKKPGRKKKGKFDGGFSGSGFSKGFGGGFD